MDGYTLRAADSAAASARLPVQLPVAGKVFAGETESAGLRLEVPLFHCSGQTNHAYRGMAERRSKVLTESFLQSSYSP